MSILTWILIYLGLSLFYLWVLRWGGAEWMEGWKSIFFIDWFRSVEWSSEQIRLYMLLCWIGSSIWFLIGLFSPVCRLSR